MFSKPAEELKIDCYFKFDYKLTKLSNGTSKSINSNSASLSESPP